MAQLQRRKLTSMLTALCVILSLLVLATGASGQCSSSINKRFARCVDMQPATLAFTYTPGTRTVAIAYSDTALSGSGWVGWGVNFNGTTMVNSDALLLFNQPANGQPTVLPYKLTAAVYNNPALPLYPATSGTSAFSMSIQNVSAVVSGTSFTILATLQLPSSSSSVINTVYNRGPSVSPALVPAPHGTGQRNGMRTVDFSTGSTSASQGPHWRLKWLHGILAAASWGTATVLGAMAARYLKPHPAAAPAWFYLHVSLQASAYLLGAVAWSMGLRLGALSPGVVHRGHRNVGIAIFCLATVQLGALVARPGTRHRLRAYWNMYHHSLGYSIIILGVANVFKGLTISSPPQVFKRAYIAFIVVAACASLGLEVLAWARFFRARQEKKHHVRDSSDHRRAANGISSAASNGTNHHTANGISSASSNGMQLADQPKWDHV